METQTDQQILEEFLNNRGPDQYDALTNKGFWKNGHAPHLPQSKHGAMVFGKPQTAEDRKAEEAARHRDVPLGETDNRPEYRRPGQEIQGNQTQAPENDPFYAPGIRLQDIKDIQHRQQQPQSTTTLNQEWQMVFREPKTAEEKAAEEKAYAALDKALNALDGLLNADLMSQNRHNALPNNNAPVKTIDEISKEIKDIHSKHPDLLRKYIENTIKYLELRSFMSHSGIEICRLKFIFKMFPGEDLGNRDIREAVNSFDPDKFQKLNYDAKPKCINYTIKPYLYPGVKFDYDKPEYQINPPRINPSLEQASGEHRQAMPQERSIYQNPNANLYTNAQKTETQTISMDNTNKSEKCCILF